jgi:DNA-binding MarR family transcriptional regulator
MRLKIMAALNVLPAEVALEFTRLKGLVNATDGNLGAHLETLERAGYVGIEKLFVGKKPQTRVKATPSGRRAFAEHVAYLREILDADGAALGRG